MTAQGDGTLRAAVAAGCDLDGVETLVVLGGDDGALVPAILERHPGIHARVCDGSLVGAVPDGADAYLLFDVLQAWDVDRAAAVLSACRAAMRGDARLLVVESVVPPDRYRALLDRSGLRLNRVIETGTAVSVLEVVR